MTTGICILGATGSIGQSTLDVISLHPDKFHLHALTAHRNVERLVALCLKHRPSVAVMVDPEAFKVFEEHIRATNFTGEILSGEQALIEVAQHPGSEKVMSAIVGAKGLLPTMAAIQAAKTVLIANKEPLVMAGSFMLQAAKESGATLLPVDSEHNAIFQGLPSHYRAGHRPEDVHKIHLTASGGPFLEFAKSQFASITPEMACQHPNWSMGQKISTDSATLMNKGLEVIEAGHLFQLNPHEIEVIIHPESIVHSLVEYNDGSYIAQMGPHDMKVAIAHCLGWPRRIRSGAPRLDLKALAELHFTAPDLQKFPCLKFAFEAFAQGGAAPAVLNAANEVAVHAFLNKQVRFDQIPAIIESVLDKYYDLDITQFEDVLFVDNLARQFAAGYVQKVDANIL